MLTPKALFTYADRFATRHEKAGRGTVYPTLRQAARRFRTTVAEVEEAVDSGDVGGYLGIAVAIGIPGVGYADLPRGEWMVEAYG